MTPILRRILGWLPKRGVQNSGSFSAQSFAALMAANTEINEARAMSVSAVSACVGLISGAIASLPLPVYRRTEKGPEPAHGHELWKLLNARPGIGGWTAATFWEYMTSSLLLQGDAFARIWRADFRAPGIIGLEPCHPTYVEVMRVEGRLKYRLSSVSGKTEVVDQDDMIHVPGLGFNGLRGQTPLSHALRNAVGTALSADDYSARFFKNNARPDFAIMVDHPLTSEQIEQTRAVWEQSQGGAQNAHRPMVLQGGAKISPLSLNAQDTQLLDTRRFAVEDIARIFGVPPHMIGQTDKASSWGTGVEQMGLGFVKYTLARHLQKFEQEINAKCLRDPYFVEFTTAGLERGDIQTRYAAHRLALGRAGEPAWMTVNEVRRLENMPAVPGGDTFPETKPVPPAGGKNP